MRRRRRSRGRVPKGDAIVNPLGAYRTCLAMRVRSAPDV